MSNGTPENPRCGVVALIGAPNAGKSTLLNTIIGTKVSIVTHKVQTTRTIVRGIAIAGDAQMIFLDTPGLFAPKRNLDRAMVHSAWSGANDADLVILLHDARKAIGEETTGVLEKLKDIRRPVFLALNKIDTLPPEKLLEVAAAFSELLEFDETFMISALSGSGVEDLTAAAAKRMPEGPWLYPEDQISDMQLRMLAAEITREKIFLRLHQELPYSMTVETEQWKTLRDGSVRIEQTVYVTRDTHKKIVLGKGGQTIRAISESAREDIAEAADQPVHLFLFVKVRENWMNDPERFQEMGLQFPGRN